MLYDTGLYIHIPFCLQKCAYCDFLSHPACEEEKEAYTNALLCELEGLKYISSDRYLSTIYTGGGTPACLGEKNLNKILSALPRLFCIDENAEFTVELNPETVTPPLLKMLKNNGVNRLSLGVQSFDDEILKKIGRVHNTVRVLESYAAMRIAGFENINYDLIFALPDQTEENFLTSVTNLLKLSPAHLSLYGLQLEHGTPLYENRKKYTFADEDTERSMYYKARALLKEHGIYQYEISNFAKPGFESRHNTRYWDAKEYIGAGAGAASYFHNVRYQNPSDTEKYIRFATHFKPLYKESTPLTTEEQMSEFAFLGLRKTCGISLLQFKEKFGKEFSEVFQSAVSKHKNNGLLCEKNGRLFLSEKGMDLANYVMEDFV